MNGVDPITEEIIVEEIDIEKEENPFTPYSNNLAVGKQMTFAQAI